MKVLTSFLILSSLLAFTLLWSADDQRTVNARECEQQTATIQGRYIPPEGYSRKALDRQSFGYYLRHLPLKPVGTHVKYYNGYTKDNRGIYDGVVDMELDAQDLQQCADAVMRLRGEYLFRQKRYEDIHFNLVRDGKPRHFLTHTGDDKSYSAFRKYMRYIFAYANTASLHDELVPVARITDVQPGDVFIQKRRPYGHAVIVMDVVENRQGDKMMLLAQSYMPAQDTQVLLNPRSKDKSCWYPVQDGPLRTPEWEFTASDLRRFP